MAVVHKKRVGIKVRHDVKLPFVITPTTPSSDVIGRFDKYDIVASEWSEKTSMQQARAGFVMQSSGEYIYAISGTNGSAILKTVEEYDVFTDEWIFKTNIPTPRCFMQSVEQDGYIYCIGGLTATGFGTTLLSRAVERYDVVNDEWEQLEPLPLNSGTMMGVAHVYNDKIYLISGYAKEFYSFNNKVLIYDILLDSWSENEISDEQLPAIERLLAFSFLKDDKIYITNGLYYKQTTPTVNGATKYLADAWVYNITTDTFSQAEQSFKDLPRTRFDGTAVSLGEDRYFIGGVNEDFNTLRFFENINTTSSPFTYTALDKLTRGRSSHGACSTGVDYGDAIWVGGGVISKFGEDFLKVVAESVPGRIRLDGRQTGAINISVYDENGDYPDEVSVRVLGSTGGQQGSITNTDGTTTNTKSDGDVVLFTKDDIVVQNGFGMATLLPRSDDSNGTIVMTDDSIREYSVVVSASVIDEQFSGDTDPPEPPGGGGSGTGGGVSGGGDGQPGGLNLPPGVIFREYNSTVDPNQTSSGTFLQLTNIGGFLSLVPTAFGQGGIAANITYFSDISWLPIVQSLIDDNEGTFDRLNEFLDRISRELPFGGSTLLDAIHKSAEIMELDSTLVKKLIYSQTDGREENSHYSLQETIDQIKSLPTALTPVNSSVFRVVPSDMHLDRGIRNSSDVADGLAENTDGTSLYITDDQNVDESIESVIISGGFIGSGVFSCVIDMEEEVLIESITVNFDLADDREIGYYRYAVAKEDFLYSPLTDRNSPDDTIVLFNTVGRYIRFIVYLESHLSLDVYDASAIIPPKMTSIDIVYHQKTESYIYWNDATGKEPHQVAITLDANRPLGSEINVGVNTQHTTMWEDYDKASSPALENDSRIIVPIRRTLTASDAFTLEELVYIDGFIYEAKYGKWTDDSTVKVYTTEEVEVDSTTYKTFPERGYVVFNTKQSDEFVLYVKDKPKLSVATKIVNRISGQPVVITGAGYFYSTLDPKTRTQFGTSVLPEAINLLLTPLVPDVNSVLTANYSYYDLSGRAEKDSSIRWFINLLVQEDIADLHSWDNKYWKLLKTGDTIYFTVEPKNDRVAGRIVKSLPVIIG